MLNNILKLSFWLGISILVLSFTLRNHYPGTEQHKVTIQFRHFAGMDALMLDSAVYKNDLGQSFRITKLKYYISNIHLIREKGGDFEVNSSFLIDDRDEKTKKITLSPVPEDSYSSMEFILGVDSLHNCNGAQSGALDPVNAMFWAWNSGYVFLKLEGKSPSSASSGNMLEYHIGGYKSPYNCIRKIKIAFPGKLFIGSEPGNKSIELKADILEILKNPVSIDFSKLSSVTDFHNSTTIANNYQDMFSLLNIHREN